MKALGRRGVARAIAHCEKEGSEREYRARGSVQGPMRLPFFGLFVLLAACTTNTVVKKGPAENAPSGEPGAEEGPGTEAAACSAAPAAPFATAKIFGTSSIDFAGDKIGVA